MAKRAEGSSAPPSHRSFCGRNVKESVDRSANVTRGAPAILKIKGRIIDSAPLSICSRYKRSSHSSPAANGQFTLDDVDLTASNEAFAVQVLASACELAIDEDRLNISGGAIALGHSFGMTGARIATSLPNNRCTHDKQIGLDTTCVGGGRGMAMIIERLA
jgi:hypothetical protein